MPLTNPPPDFAATSLAALAEWAQGDRLPPVADWHPAREGVIDIVIRADGRWFHEGGEITRPAMVRLFSRILRREEDGRHVLVTPAEKLTIGVEDAAFLAVEMKCEDSALGQTLAFRLNTGDVVIAGPDHPLVLRAGPAGLLPYLQVRTAGAGVLEARLARPVYYDLALLADEAGRVASGGVSFAVGEMGDEAA
ncbi:DUF1285 domain-containing protein [Sphingomonas lacunae]|uniref:DUF1285 domain-containing protein n=1 Tax=Sphingomonas lacunae TaxID=2698828 RepID=A0A6M4ATJ9_9SPHN|nr:DUF1285 domain-containing protein [Sphingomonas lacunae]QJQ31642.1 DUF1285 domain-containing protein [Sphingomonas lacunae]